MSDFIGLILARNNIWFFMFIMARIQTFGFQRQFGSQYVNSFSLHMGSQILIGFSLEFWLACMVWFFSLILARKKENNVSRCFWLTRYILSSRVDMVSRPVHSSPSHT